MPNKDKRSDAQQALVDMRVEKGWSQQYLATALGRATISVGKWETEREPGLDVLEQLAKFAGRHKLPAIAFRFRLAAAKRQGFGLERDAESLFLYSVVLQNGHLVSEERSEVHELITRALSKLVQAQERGEWVRGIDPSDLKWLGRIIQRSLEAAKATEEQRKSDG